MGLCDGTGLDVGSRPVGELLGAGDGLGLSVGISLGPTVVVGRNVVVGSIDGDGVGCAVSVGAALVGL